MANIVIDQLTTDITFECNGALASVLNAQMGLTPWWRWLKLWRLGRELRRVQRDIAAEERAEHLRQLRKIEAQVGAA